MTDIPITAAVVGGRQAVSDLDRLAARTKVAANTVGEHERALKRRNAELRQGAAAGGQIGGAGRIGGAIGGATNVAQQGGGAMLLAGTLAVAGTAVQVFTRMLELSASVVRAEVEGRKKGLQIAAEGQSARTKGAASWLASEGERRIALQAAGGKGLLGTVESARGRGVDISGGALALAKAGQAGGNNLWEMERSVATRLVDSETAAKAILDGAKDMRQILSAALGRDLSWGQVNDMQQGANRAPEGKALAEVASIKAQELEVQRVRVLEGGLATIAAKESLTAAKSPETAALLDLFTKSQADLGVLAEMAKSEGWLGRYFRDLTSPQGSFYTQLSRALRESGGTLNGAAAGAGF